ncbi:UDP-N-acetylglucosamine diphosphorylase [Methylacidiphilum kamchatkense Kam1]|uniref:Transferase family hexapeptide repeat protein n=1 Tax=Methylacidiphilum kamchatkense Kam1 TaxID=1202785 RepID=A0A0C1V6L9_9BACT|nr:UDP-N-acetylglucosamine diphosphorylase [Methylacidiphilum kamchatkense]KIE59365.1 UDP-N-acetylglucosamine diphosphorylase [Methylacidiphilum kamchatkense Kam1]QDQ42659.1 transferase family hexapeptide repeat protein [Methylacidiphilum kamchatkense Kam1]
MEIPPLPSFHPVQFFDLSQTRHQKLFHTIEKIWQVLPRIETYLEEILCPGLHGEIAQSCYIGPKVYVGKGTIIYPGAMIEGPAWIGENCQIRTGCFIRKNVIIEEGCILGNSCEFKNSFLFKNCQVPHFNYVGDSILGTKVHLGAGVILSNLKLDGSEIKIKYNGNIYPTGLRKFGAILGDGIQIGCNAVLNPGSILGKKTVLFPGVIWHGVLLEEGKVIKYKQNVEIT